MEQKLKAAAEQWQNTTQVLMRDYAGHPGLQAMCGKVADHYEQALRHWQQAGAASKHCQAAALTQAMMGTAGCGKDWRN